MLKGVHFLLTYTCTWECDHCFVYSSPEAIGTFTITQISDILRELEKIGTVEWIYFEGGEPFLFYPVMLEGLRLAQKMGFKTGIVTNAYWATSEKDAELWLKPLCDLRVSDVSISVDSFHFDDEEDNEAIRAVAVAKRLGLPLNSICIERPVMVEACPNDRGKGEPVVGGIVMFKGRAAEKLVEGLPKRPWKEFIECPHEDLEDPGRVHIDNYGNVHLCQGLSMGNYWETPISKLIQNYRAESHPICQPLVKGGPAQLANKYGIQPNEEYVDACHFCYSVRKSLIGKFPQFLAPKQIYGL